MEMHLCELWASRWKHWTCGSQTPPCKNSGNARLYSIISHDVEMRSFTIPPQNLPIPHACLKPRLHGTFLNGTVYIGLSVRSFWYNGLQNVDIWKCRNILVDSHIAITFSGRLCFWSYLFVCLTPKEVVDRLRWNLPGRRPVGRGMTDWRLTAMRTIVMTLLYILWSGLPDYINFIFRHRTGSRKTSSIEYTHAWIK